MFAEDAPTEEGGIVLQSRAGLADRSVNMGAGPVQALFRSDGVLSGDLFGVSGGALYEGSTLVYALSGVGTASIAGYESHIFANAGGNVVQWDGVSASTVTIPDLANVRKVLVGASRLIVIRDDTEQFYWSDPLTATIDGLAFASAENQPDRLKDALFIDDVLILFGSQTTEFWPNTGDATAPFQPLEGRVFECGIKATGCATGFGSTFAWVTNRNEVCVSDPGSVISHPGLNAKIEASAAVSLWAFVLDGVELLALSLDEETWVYSARSQEWSQFDSYGETNWIARCWADGVFGSVDGKTLAWGSDEIEGELVRLFRAGAPVNSGGFTVDNLSLRTNPGGTAYLSGNFTPMTVELRLSRDNGKTWGAWKARSLGAQGEYRQLVQWRGLGMASRPSLLCEFRVSDPGPFAVSDVRINEGFGGR
jgi:hypothetical protein